MKTLAFIAVLFSAAPAFAYIDAFPSFLNFGDTVVNRRSFSQSVTVSNRGQDDVNYVSISPSCGLAFDISNGSCFGRLGPNQSCSFNVTFSPNREGYQSCSIYISTSAGSHSVSASGRGVKSPYLKKAAPRAMPKRK